MTTILDNPSQARPPKSLREVSTHTKTRHRRNRATTWILAFATYVACVPLILIVTTVLYQGVQVMTPNFFLTDPLTARSSDGGFRVGFVGTFYIMFLAVPMTLIVGIATAIYLTEYGKGRTATLVRFVTDIMTGVPSIFVGLFVYAVLVLGTGPAALNLGFGTFVGAVAISIIMLPIVIRSSEEMLKLVPINLRSAAFGLGARRYQTVFRVVLPAAGPGLTTTALLAIARGIGETAPLLLTILGTVHMTFAFQGEPQGALPMLIHNNAVQPFLEGQMRAWGGALSLILICLLLTIIGKIYSRRRAKLHNNA
ncbi:phosphate ABC transporter permease PstA [Natronoglycomyces albus]|uniref:Phosphate transport system permease protein PstA n=1 Tax=Natronoglycomyces albus TaxID=2811108 RepID=A0A895XU73_9ACTN|nr:phosphate ABC transporter permease PstA [Natronoglycomyces albus]QSB06076.1 phosphate ABC transporter permease PstA [Natronoglycomyces albus]